MFLGRLNLRSATLMVTTPLLLVAFAGVTPPANAAKQVTTQSATLVKAAHTVHVVLMLMNPKTIEFMYKPETIVVKVGDIVEWKNKDIYRHTVTSIKGKTLDSGDIAPGKSWRYHAVKRGTFNYYCTLHPNMKGKLIVQ